MLSYRLSNSCIYSLKTRQVKTWRIGEAKCLLAFKPQKVEAKIHCEGELINMTRAWDKEKFWVPDRNRTHDLPNTGRALYPVSYENSWRARPFNSMSSRSSLDRAPARCSEGHGFDSCRGTQNFSLSHARVMLINWPSHFITELKIHHLY